MKIICGKKEAHEQCLGSSEKRDVQGNGGGGNSNTQSRNSIDNYILHFFSICFQRALSTVRFIRLFDLVKVPQMGGNNCYYHFIVEKTEALKGVK